MYEVLPKYDEPPVNETVLGVSFRPILAWHAPHFGLYWNRIRKNYPRFSAQPALPIEKENFAKGGMREISLKFGQPDERYWFVDTKDEWLVQVQNTRFYSNWRKAKDVAYPNYDGFSDRFRQEWNEFKSFLTYEKMPGPELVQAEVSYVNHITVENDFSNLDEVFPVWAGLKDREEFLGKPESVGLTAAYVIPENRGRLYLAMQPVVRHEDVTAVIQFTLTAKVLIASNNDGDLFDALNLGHKWVVCGFTEFTSGKMHSTWKRTK